MAGELKERGAPAQAARPTPSTDLARFAVRTRADELPPEVMHEARRALVNAFATALAGCREPGVRSAARVLSRLAGQDGECTVIGHADGAGLLQAASLNAMSINVFDFDDTHIPTILHPTAPILPVVFALAQTRRVSGRELLAAFAVGVEVECRIANAISPWHYQRGWHITSTCGVFGAAAAAGRLLGLDERAMRWALGNASAQSSGLVETLGTMSKSIGVGNAASNGIVSALLAAEGFEGPDEPLLGPRGFLRVVGDRIDEAALSHGLGQSWQLMRNTYKPYPCGVVLNPVIEACLALHHEDGVRLADVAGVRLVGHPLLRERTDRPAPRVGRESQVSALHAVAVALAHGRAGLDEFSDAGVADPALGGHALALEFRDDASMGVEAATVEVRLRDGTPRTRAVRSARGSLDAPLSDADLEAKLRTLCAWGESACEPQPLLDALWALERSDDAGRAMRLAAGAAAR